MSIQLTSMDPEPPLGAYVRDSSGHVWQRYDNFPSGNGIWECIDRDDDPESWVKIAGGGGSVTLLKRICHFEDAAEPY